MNIGFVVHNLHRREGTGGYVSRLLPYVAREHEVTVYAARFREPVPEGVTAVHVPAVMWKAATAILTFPRAFGSVRRSHDIVHAQGWVTDSADVVTAHIVMAAWRDAQRQTGIAPRIGERLVSPIVKRQEAKLLGQRAKRLIVPSVRVKDEIEQHYNRTAGVDVVPHGFPTIGQPVDRAAARRRLGLPADVPIALYAGDVRKGFCVAAEAVAATPSCHLAVVSRSTHPGRRLGGVGGLGRRFHWIGELTELSDAYVAADLLVHPTIYDSFGLVVAEAMAYGVPPIVTQAAGITDLISHRESGWVVDGDRLSGTSEGITALMSDGKLRERISSGARAVAKARTWERVARETLEVYEKVHTR